MQSLYDTRLRAYVEQVETFLRGLCPTEGETVHYAVLPEAQRYSLLAGGKRIRPVLTLAFCELFGGEAENAMPYACALEMIHTYSLIHDDLPCMDDDDLRRGRPTNHKVYGEAVALQAGDALLTDAFALAVENPRLSPAVNARAVAMLARAAGSCGMVGGQVLDLMGERAQTRPDYAMLKRMHRLKTGALIRVAATLGALAAGVPEGDTRMADAAAYAEGIGEVFQIVDDILDVTGDAQSLGKTPGSDAVQGKTTTLSYMSIDEAFSLAAQCNARACESVAGYENNGFLIELAERLLNRHH